MHKIIILEKYSSSCFFWQNLIKNKKIEGLTVEEVIKRYQGYEGGLVFLSIANKSKTQLSDIVNQYLELKRHGQYLMLHVFSENETMPQVCREQAFRLGYDFGVCEEEKTIYSSIFNEILFGNLEELIYYKNFLNENLLFSNLAIAEKYASLHNTLSILEKGVEDYEPMKIYEIWKQMDQKKY